jgi:hypothetical protein
LIEIEKQKLINKKKKKKLKPQTLLGVYFRAIKK